MSGELLSELFSLRDAGYGDFTASLIPTLDRERVIGVRIPELRRLAGKIRKEGGAAAFLSELPHNYLEEDLLHSILLSGERDTEKLYPALERFLPFVNNWSVCDSLRPGAFKKHPADLPGRVEAWLASDHPYTVRFGIGTLMTYYLDGCFETKYPEQAASVRSEDYYVRMMAAWYFATALAKQYEAVLPFLEEHRLDPWTHNKAIQKALESYRIPPERKAFLRTLRLKTKR